MGMTCGRYGGEGKCVRGLVGKTEGKYRIKTPEKLGGCN
jgi:hypothetical protein